MLSIFRFQDVQGQFKDVYIHAILPNGYLNLWSTVSMWFLGCTLLHSMQTICRQLPGCILFHSCIIGIMSLANSLVTTASTNTRNATFKIVHSDLLIHQMFISNKNNVTNLESHIGYHTVQCSKIIVIYKQVDTKTAGAVILQLVLKLQKRNNFSVIPI